MNFKTGQKVRIIKKSVGISYENSTVCKSCCERGFVTYVEKILDNSYGTGHIHMLSNGEMTADFIDGDFILLPPSIIEIDE